MLVYIGGLECAFQTGFTIKDIDITVALPAVGQIGGFGISNYGLHFRNCTSFSLYRMIVTASQPSLSFSLTGFQIVVAQERMEQQGSREQVFHSRNQSWSRWQQWYEWNN